MGTVVLDTVGSTVEANTAVVVGANIVVGDNDFDSVGVQGKTVSMLVSTCSETPPLLRMTLLIQSPSIQTSPGVFRGREGVGGERNLLEGQGEGVWEWREG